MDEINVNKPLSSTTINKPIIDITVIGVGGAGNNTLENIPQKNFEGVKFLFANTDKQVLDKFNPEQCIFLSTGDKNIDGLGAGANPKLGELAATNSIEQIRESLKNTRLLLLTAGLGGGTGTGASPIIAKVAKEMNILTIAIVTIPFSFEGPARRQNANIGFEKLKKNVDSIIVVSNDKLLNNYPDIAMNDAFTLTNNVLKNCVKFFTDLMLKRSIINLDFADLSSITKNKGEAYIGFGKGVGKNKITRAIEAALDSKIIETSIKGSKNAIVNIIADPTVSVQQTYEIVDALKKSAALDSEMDIIFGFDINQNLRNEIQISIIATFDKDNKEIRKQQFNLENNEFDELRNQKEQETLLRIGDTLEHELTNQQSLLSTELDLKQLDYIDDFKDQDEVLIEFDETNDDDIPFFLK